MLEAAIPKADECGIRTKEAKQLLERLKVSEYSYWVRMLWRSWGAETVLAPPRRTALCVERRVLLMVVVEGVGPWYGAAWRHQLVYGNANG